MKKVNEQRICMVCGNKFDTGRKVSVQSHERESVVTGYDVCSPHKRDFVEGWIWVIEFDPDKTNNLSLDGIYRTGRALRIHKDDWPNVITIPVPDPPIATIPIAIYEKLRDVVNAKKAEDSNE